MHEFKEIKIPMTLSECIFLICQFKIKEKWGRGKETISVKCETLSKMH